MNKLLTYILFIVILASCSEDVNLSVDYTDAVEVPGVEAVISDGTSTRAAALDKDNYVGRSEFINGDVMLLTSIKRTVNPISQFTYYDIEYSHTDGSWNRKKETGYTGENQNNPDRIYWSDAISAHTYIGYSLPQGTFDWKYNNESKVYYGSLGNPQADGIIDYSNTNDDVTYKTGNDKIKSDDLLLTHAIDKVAETGGSVAKLYYHHALAMVRVIVNIQGFAASENSDDAKAVVSDMVLKKMLTMYKWTQGSYRAEALSDGDDTILSSLYEGESKPTHNQRKDTKLWIPRPVGTGTGVGKQFAFYGLAVPVTSTDLTFSFKVTYPDPMNPQGDPIKNPYLATLNSVEFRAGYCTTINITLNHQEEQMTVGAEYMDWQLVETPDEGELKKNLTFLEHTDRSKVTIFGDDKATIDDATWLYVDPTTNKILDIYGNDGTVANPFKISTAEQLLSFAYEVKGTDRKEVKVLNISPPEEHTLIAATGGFDFKGYYVKLDADITMQKSLEIMHDAGGFYKFGSENAHDYSVNTQGVTWPGIGDKDHKFNGIFNGGYRHINRLYGEPFFNTIGPDGIVDHIFITDALGITGRGSIAEVNNGVICGAYIEGDVVATKDSNTTGDHSNCCGSIVGENHSMLISCAHIGDIKGTGYDIVGALLGYNDGIVAICYNCGDVNGNGVAEYAGIGDYSARSIAYCSYFNGDLYKGHGYDDLNARIGHVAYPLTTAMMQSNVFVNKEATASADGMTTTGGEIIDDGLGQKKDPFFFHLSLNGGIKRSVVMLKQAVKQTEDALGYIPIHSASTDPNDPNKYEELRLKKSLVQWLIDHYSTEKTVDDKKELEFSLQFRFIPGTYPKLQ